MIILTRPVANSHRNDRDAGRDGDTVADFAQRSLGSAAQPQARGLDVLDNIGAVNAFGGQIHAFRSQMPKHGTAAFVDRGNVSQMKPNWCSFGKSLNTAGLNRLDGLPGERTVNRDGCACEFVRCQNPDHRPLPLQAELQVAIQTG